MLACDQPGLVTHFQTRAPLCVGHELAAQRPLELTADVPDYLRPLLRPDRGGWPADPVQS